MTLSVANSTAARPVQFDGDFDPMIIDNLAIRKSPSLEDLITSVKF